MLWPFAANNTLFLYEHQRKLLYKHQANLLFDTFGRNVNYIFQKCEKREQPLNCSVKLPVKPANDKKNISSMVILITASFFRLIYEMILFLCKMQPRNFKKKMKHFLSISHFIEKSSFMTSSYSIFLFYVFIVA